MDDKCAVCIDNNGKDSKLTSHVARSIFYKYGPIDHATHVPVLVSQSSAEN